MNQQKHRVLVLDDDPDIGMMIKMMLEYRGYSVLLIERADKAEDIIREDHFDLLIMDMLLSGTNGTEVCKLLKQNKDTGHLPVIMISAHPNARESCLAAGADEFIAKPFDLKDLLAVINHLVPEQKN